MRHGPIYPRTVPLPLTEYGFEDQDPSFFDKRFEAGISYVDSPVHSGSYALKVYTPPYPNNANPYAVKSFPTSMRTVYFRFYLLLPGYPGHSLYYVFNAGWFREAPYWGFFSYAIRLGIFKSGTSWFFNLRDTNVGSAISLNTWYLLEFLASETLNKVEMKIDGTLVRSTAYPIPSGQLQHYGFQMYPTRIYPAGGQTFYVDDLATWSEGWIGGI